MNKKITESTPEQWRKNMGNVMRADRTMCFVNEGFLEQAGDDLGYVKANDGVWVPKCDLEQYNAGIRKPVLPVSELVRCAAEKLKSINVNVNSSDLISFSIDYDWKIEIHLDSIAHSIQAVNAIQAGVDIEIVAGSISEQKLVTFNRDGVRYIGFISASTVDEWKLAE